LKAEQVERYDSEHHLELLSFTCYLNLIVRAVTVFCIRRIG